MAKRFILKKKLIEKVWENFGIPFYNKENYLEKEDDKYKTILSTNFSPNKKNTNYKSMSTHCSHPYLKLNNNFEKSVFLNNHDENEFEKDFQEKSVDYSKVLILIKKKKIKLLVHILG